MPLKIGPVPFHMIFQLHFHYVIPIIIWPIYSDLSRRRSISFDVHDSSFYFIVLSYCVSLRSEFRYDFRIKTIQGSSLPPVVCRRVHVLFTLFVFVYVWHIVLCFVFLRLVYPMLPVSLECPFVISLSVFSDVYFILNMLEVSVMIFSLKSNVL
jgi:hypothetical protein